MTTPTTLVYERPEGFTDIPTHYCPGCTHGVAHRLVAEVLEEMGHEITVATLDVTKPKHIGLPVIPLGEQDGGYGKSQKILDKLFNEGKAVSHNGFTLVYLFVPLQTIYPAQAGFSVPTRHFKHAHERNRIKRLMREAYRHHKLPLYEKLVTQQQQMAMMWVYKGKALPDYETVTKEVLWCLGKLGG